MIEDWDLYSRKLGYKNEQDMLQDMYTNEELSISEIAGRLNVAQYSIQRRLDNYNIPRRKRGGANNSAEQTKKLFHLDQRIILTLSITKLSTEIGISTSLIYKYRKNVLGDQNGILCSKSHFGIDALQHFVDQTSLTSADQEQKLREFLRSEEEGR